MCVRKRSRWQTGESTLKIMISSTVPAQAIGGIAVLSRTGITRLPYLGSFRKQRKGRPHYFTYAGRDIMSRGVFNRLTYIRSKVNAEVNSTQRASFVGALVEVN